MLSSKDERCALPQSNGIPLRNGYPFQASLFGQLLLSLAANHSRSPPQATSTTSARRLLQQILSEVIALLEDDLVSSEGDSPPQSSVPLLLRAERGRETACILICYFRLLPSY